jgi:hypothetical protein
VIGCEFCIRDPEGPSEFCAACLIKQREDLRRENRNLAAVVDDNYALLVESRAEVDRLREALRTIAGHAGTWQADVAREALEAGER